jgi:hypothetical protein
MKSTHWWKLGLSTGLLLGNAGFTFGQVLVAPTGYPPWPITKTKPLARGSLLHPANWPETPLGSSVALHAEMQITNAVASRMILHDYDFVPDTAELNDRGRDRLVRIAALLPHNQLPVIVERLPNAPRLTEARRRSVVAVLGAAAGRLPAERVVVGPTLNYPLQGPEAELIYLNLLRLADSAGTVPGTGVQTGPTTGIVTGGGVGTGTSGTGTGGTR